MLVPKHWTATIPNNTFALAEQIGQGTFRVSLRKVTNFFVFYELSFISVAIWGQLRYDGREF